MTPSKRFIIISLIIIFLSSVFIEPALAARKLEVQIPGLETTTLPALPDYIFAIYKFSLMAVGIICLGALIYGGFRYLISAGKPAAMTDAKDQIFSALLGLIILFSAWLILNTINPELIILSEPTKETMNCDAANPCPSQTCVEEKCSYEPERPCSDPIVDCSALVCIYDCSSGTCTAEGVCGLQSSWGCSAHTTQGQGQCEADANCDWCPMCSGNQTNSYQKDICLTTGIGINCIYDCVKDQCGAECDDLNECTAPQTCQNCVCQ